MYLQLTVLIFLAATIIAATPKDTEVLPTNFSKDNMTSDHKTSASPTTEYQLTYYSQPTKEAILNRENSYRNKTAAAIIGKIKKIACRLPTIKWSDELENLAANFIQNCSVNFDKCQNNTNLLYTEATAAVREQNYVDDHGIEMKNVFLDFDDVDKQILYHEVKTYPSYMWQNRADYVNVPMSERLTHIGCASAIYPEVHHGRNTKVIFINCIMNTNSTMKSTESTTCKTAGELCKTGTNPKYPNLCSEMEKYD